jgi:hypothetical protein
MPSELLRPNKSNTMEFKIEWLPGLVYLIKTDQSMKLTEASRKSLTKTPGVFFVLCQLGVILSPDQKMLKKPKVSGRFLDDEGNELSFSSFMERSRELLLIESWFFNSGYSGYDLIAYSEAYTRQLKLLYQDFLSLDNKTGTDQVAICLGPDKEFYLIALTPDPFVNLLCLLANKQLIKGGLLTTVFSCLKREITARSKALVDAQSIEFERQDLPEALKFFRVLQRGDIVFNPWEAFSVFNITADLNPDALEWLFSKKLARELEPGVNIYNALQQERKKSSDTQGSTSAGFALDLQTREIVLRYKSSKDARFQEANINSHQFLDCVGVLMIASDEKTPCLVGVERYINRLELLRRHGLTLEWKCIEGRVSLLVGVDNSVSFEFATLSNLNRLMHASGFFVSVEESDPASNLLALRKIFSIAGCFNPAFPNIKTNFVKNPSASRGIQMRVDNIQNGSREQVLINSLDYAGWFSSLLKIEGAHLFPPEESKNSCAGFERALEEVSIETYKHLLRLFAVGLFPDYVGEGETAVFLKGEEKKESFKVEEAQIVRATKLLGGLTLTDVPHQYVILLDNLLTVLKTQANWRRGPEKRTGPNLNLDVELYNPETSKEENISLKSSQFVGFYLLLEGIQAFITQLCEELDQAKAKVAKAQRAYETKSDPWCSPNLLGLPRSKLTKTGSSLEESRENLTSTAFFVSAAKRLAKAIPGSNGFRRKPITDAKYKQLNEAAGDLMLRYQGFFVAQESKDLPGACLLKY